LKASTELSVISTPELFPEAQQGTPLHGARAQRPPRRQVRSWQSSTQPLGELGSPACGWASAGTEKTARGGS